MASPITSARPTPTDPLADPIPELKQPTEAEFVHAGDVIVRWTARHLATLGEQSIGRTGTPAALRELFPPEAPEQGRAFDELFADIRENLFPHAFRNNHPRFLAFIPCWPSAESVLGEWLTAATNFYGGIWMEGSGPAHLETTVLGWFRDWLGLPESTRGVLTAGGSEANLTALVVARESLPPEARERSVIYLSAARHWSVDKALRVMGHPASRVRHVPVDETFLFDIPALREAIQRDRQAGLHPWAVVGNAGATNTGAIDPLEALAGVAAENGLWLHVDAAYGWSGVLDPDEKPALSGIERADSVTLDPHKWFAQPYESGCLLVREGRRLPETFADRPDYLEDAAPVGEETNYSDHGLSLSRRFRAFKIWFAVQSLGVGWHRQLITHGCRLARYAEERLRSRPEFELQSPRHLSILCFRYHRPGVNRDWDALNRRLLAELRESGVGFLSSTKLRGQLAIRMCFVSGRTTPADVDLLLDFLAGAGERAERAEDAGRGG